MPLVGAQRPRVCSLPPSVDTLGVEAVEFSESIGLVLDPWQQFVVNGALGVRSDGKWAAFEFALLVARQNGKGGFLEAFELAKLFLFGSRLILHSAHEFKTAQEAFLRVKALIDGSDELTRKVARVRTSHGEEGIELLSGARLRFVARSRSSGRGFSGDDVILDEAQELPRLAMEALMPTMSARPNPQLVYTGTVPSEQNDAEHWESVRDRGRAGGDSSLGWMEWSPPEPDPDEDGGNPLDDPEGLRAFLDDRDNWLLSNPAQGIRITEETIERERNSLGDEGFARERLSHWPSSTSKSAIDDATWKARADGKSKLLDPVAFSVDVSPDRKRASISAYGRRSDGRGHGEVIDNRPKTGWVLDRMVELAEKHESLGVVIDAAGPAASLIPELQERGVTVITTSAQEMAHACGGIYDDIEEDQFRHLDDPRLNAAVSAAAWRPLGDARAFRRKDDSTDITPLISVTLARFGHLKNAAKPKPKPKTGNAVFR